LFSEFWMSGFSLSFLTDQMKEAREGIGK